MAKAGESSFSDEIMESDIEFEGEVVEPDNDFPQKMGDPSVEVSEEKRDKAQLYKKKGVDVLSEGKLNEAIEHLTEGILLNPTLAILYATRAGVFVKMKKPNAAIRDADAALQINPDSAKGYKSRGMAKTMLGKWEDAAHDLHYVLFEHRRVHLATSSLRSRCSAPSVSTLFWYFWYHFDAAPAGKVPGVYDDWEDYRRQVHRFSGNSYKGYPTLEEAETRYARFLVRRRREMWRRRMTPFVVMMLIFMSAFMFCYVILV